MAERASLPTVALLLAALLTACGGSPAAAPGEVSGTRLDDGTFEVSSTPLVDPSGDPYSLADDTEKPLTLVFFGYTHCPDICGQVMATLAGTMTRLDDADRDDVDVVFVTTDPQRDDEAVVERYATKFDAEFLGLTGSLDDIVEVAQSVGIGVEQGEKLPSGGYDVTHGTQVMALDADDQVPVYWSHEVSQAELARDVQLLLDEG